MTDTPTPTKTRKPVRKGAPPTPTETLGALTAPAEAAAPAAPPKAAKPARAKPAPKAVAAKPVPAAETEAPKRARKPASERTKPLNFRVTNEFRKAFKQAAAAEDCKKVELLERMFDAWKATHA